MTTATKEQKKAGKKKAATKKANATKPDSGGNGVAGRIGPDDAKPPKPPAKKKPARKKAVKKKGSQKKKPRRFDVFCDRKALIAALKPLKPLARNGGLYCTPTQHVVITAVDDTLAVRATDLETSLRCIVQEADVQCEGTAAVPLCRLLDTLQSGESAIVRLIEADENRLRVLADDSEITLTGLAAEEVPAFPDTVPAGSIEIPAGHLAVALDEVIYAVASETSRFAINGVKAEARRGGTFTMAATDGRRLVVKRSAANASGDMDGIISPTTAKLLMRLAGALDPDDVIKIVCGGGDKPDAPAEIAIDDRDWSLRANLVEGTFPPYEDVIPPEKSAKTRVITHGDQLGAAVKQAHVVNDDHNIVRVHFGSKGIAISATDVPGEADVHTCKIDHFDGPEVTMGFNALYLRDLAAHCRGDMRMMITAANKPLLVLGNESVHVIMPVNLQS